MDINFKNIVIDNFLSFGHAEIDLEDKGLCLIKGVNNNVEDNALSNGSGKSTIFNALSYALTGETIQGLSSNLNNIVTNEDMSVKLIFTVDNNEFELLRSKSINGKSDLKVIINGEDKSGKGIRESEAVLANYLPDLTSDLIGELILIGQGMPHKFSSNSPSGRKELLEQLTHSDFMFQEIKDKISNRLSELKAEQNNIDNLIQIEEALKKSTETNIVKENEKLNNLSSQEEIENSINLFKDKIEIETTDINNLKTSIENENVTLESLREKLNKLVSEENSKIEEETSVFHKHNLSVNNDLIETKVKLSTLNIEIEKLNNIRDVCPTCGQKIPYVHKPDISEQLKEKEELEKKLKELTEKNEAQTNSYNLNIEDIKKEYGSQIFNCNEAIGNCKDKLVDYNRRLKDNENKLQKDSEELNKYIKEKELFETTKANYIKNIEDWKKAVEESDNKIIKYSKDSDTLLAHLNMVDKINTIVKRDFRGVLLADIIKYIDSKLKQYSIKVFNTDKISFELNGNNIDIKYLDKPLELLSGGEQQKINLLLQFTIRSMVQEYVGFNSNILVLDEILDNLDAKGCDEILNFISDCINDISSVFIISHHADSLNICNDSMITVIKNKIGVSSII